MVLYARLINRYGDQTRNVGSIEVHSDPNKHDFAVLKMAGVSFMEKVGWNEGDPVRLQWGMTGRGVVQREIAGYVSDHRIDHEAQPVQGTEIHMLGMTSVLQTASPREEEWHNRSAVSVIEEVLARFNLRLNSVGVSTVRRVRIYKPAEQSYWDFLVELATGVGGTLHPMNEMVLLLGHLEHLVLDETLRQSKGSSFGMKVRSSSRTGDRVRKRWEVKNGDVVLDHRHLPDDMVDNRTEVPLSRLRTDRYTFPNPVPYVEAREKLIALSFQGMKHVEADLELKDPLFSAFSGASLRVRTRRFTTLGGVRIETGEHDSGIWRIGKLRHYVDLRGPSYTMEADLSRSGLGPQTLRKTRSAEPYARHVKKFHGRMHATKGWAA